MYIQLHPDNTFWRELPDGNFEFSPTVFQPPRTLTPEQAAPLRVHPLVRIGQPEHDPITQGVRLADPSPVEGVWTQQWDVFPLPAEEVEANQAAAVQAAREKAKADRQAVVDAIKVTTQAGNTFDGDEISQTRMVRAIIALQATGTPSVAWVLADNTAIQATAAELSEALALSGAAQAAVWTL